MFFPPLDCKDIEFSKHGYMPGMNKYIPYIEEVVVNKICIWTFTGNIHFFYSGSRSK